jgi:hypothetical protein
VINGRAFQLTNKFSMRGGAFKYIEKNAWSALPFKELDTQNCREHFVNKVTHHWIKAPVFSHIPLNSHIFVPP